MTWSNRRHRSARSKRRFFYCPVVSPAALSVVVPVKDNAPGVLRLLRTFALLRPSVRPACVIIVDNNSSPPLQLQGNWPLPVYVLRCDRKGPAAARNDGWRAARTEWVLFMDSDCVPTESLLPGFCSAADGSIAYAGAVEPLDEGWLVDYYHSQKILEPPPEEDGRPAYLVTANALVLRQALDFVGGFNERFELAAGEDIDLGWRLRRFGELAYAPRALMLHEFGNNLNDFVTRFKRYGVGNLMLEQLHATPMTPKAFAANSTDPMHKLCAVAQYVAMTYGYISGAYQYGPQSGTH